MYALLTPLQTPCCLPAPPPPLPPTHTRGSEKDAFRRDPDAPAVAHLSYLKTRRGTRLLTRWACYRCVVLHLIPYTLYLPTHHASPPAHHHRPPPITTAHRPLLRGQRLVGPGTQGACVGPPGNASREWTSLTSRDTNIPSPWPVRSTTQATGSSRSRGVCCAASRCGAALSLSEPFLIPHRDHVLLTVAGTPLALHAPRHNVSLCAYSHQCRISRYALSVRPLLTSQHTV